MKQLALSILDQHRIMALATLRPDGWPQTTMVSYVHDSFSLYFLISRTSQKFVNMDADTRVSIAIGSDSIDPKAIRGLSLAAHAEEVRDEPYRSQFCERLAARHPGYFDPDQLMFSRSALMRARPQVITVSDFSKGLGHADRISLGPNELMEMGAVRADDWGPNPQATR
jgi:nitroimidazol reductase NimA-like FMN-containing flavoprotein (pyridoxamine 5'-phosphate oxidase superfamily)